MYLEPFQCQCNYVVLLLGHQGESREPWRVFTLIRHNRWQLLMLRSIAWTSISVHLYLLQNTLTSTLLVFYCFCSLCFWVWRPLYFILCCVAAVFLIFFFTGCSQRHHNKQGPTSVSGWTNSKKINTVVDWTLKSQHGSRWRVTATVLELSWRQIGVASLRSH